MSSLTVSCIADEEFKKRLKLLAIQKNISMARLVRDALDAVYGKELAASFFADGVSVEIHSNSTSNGEKINELIEETA